MNIYNPIVTKWHIDHNCLNYEKPICRYLSQCTEDGEGVGDNEWWCGWCTHPAIQEFSDQFLDMKEYLTLCPRNRSNKCVVMPLPGHGIMRPCK